VSAGQAANKSYVDLGVAGKADLISGLVPTGELGTGTANNALCLHGDSSWGGCGISSNAVSIQNVPVATTAPTNNQVMTYVAALGEYAPQAGGGVTAGMQAVKYATDFSWTQSPSANLGTAGAQTVNLAVCPTGVTGSEPWYYVYISGTGTAEAVLVNGGSCAGNGQAGTLQFTTLNAHPAGYAIGSASGGLQEALIAARFVASNPSGPSQSGKVIVPPGELQAYARVSVRASNVTVDFSGSIMNCYMADTCIFAGDPSNSNAFLDITLLNPRGRPMVISGQNPFVEVNAQKTRLLNLTSRIPPTGGTFSSYVQVDGDQSFLLDGLDTALATGSSDYGVLCNATVCNPVIYAPGPFTSNAAVGWLKHLNISMQCAGNGIDWQSGNTLRISDSVIEGFAQYGVRAGIKRGGYNGFELDNVYEEVGSCTNPAGAIGEAGVIAQGATVKIEGAILPAGVVPLFANTGSTDYRYYIVANNSTYGASNPLYAGRALTNGSGNITVTTPDVAGATSFDLLRVTYLNLNNPREQAPYGTGSYAVVVGVNRAAACSSGVCTFTDTQAGLRAYTVATPSYFPMLDYWPGNLILAANQDSANVLNGAKAWVQSAPSDIVAVQGSGTPAVISTECQAVNGWTPLWMSCYTSMAPGTFYDQGAFLLAVKPNQDGGLLTNLKGRLNFPTLGTGPGHIITLSDSNFQKTIATANNRPSNDASDAFIGYDQGDGNPAHVGISMGAPVSLSNYIGNVGDGANWVERLTSGLKEFKTSVQADNSLTVAGTAQVNSLLTTGAGAWAVQGSFGTLSPALAGKSAIGFGAGGHLQVSENGGAVVGLAELDSNGDVSENANTATQLAQTPTQCNGSFVTGVQANGNANCSVADVVELAETGPPSGIPNYGIFWFDSTCHCPKVISNNGQPVQLGLLNAFNLDANTLEEYNGANPQALNIYGTRADASDYQRMRLGYDTTDGYFFVGSDASGSTMQQQGLGFWLQGSLRWVVDTSFNFKPWSDNVKDVGSPTLRLKHLYTGTYVDTTAGAVATDLPNAAITGTTLNKLAKVTGSPATAIIASTSDTSGIIGVVVDGAGTTLSAQIARGGQASCAFDGGTNAGDYVQISNATGGDCHDAGASYPGIGQVLGRVLSTNASAGTYAMLVAGSEVQAPTAGTVSTVFGRAGTITAQAGDYSVGQITGAAPVASPALSGMPTAPTPTTGDNSTNIATTAWVKNQGYGTGIPSSQMGWTPSYSSTSTITGYPFPWLNESPFSGSDRCAAWNAAIATSINGVKGFPSSAVADSATSIACNSNMFPLTGQAGGVQDLPSGLISATVPQVLQINQFGVVGTGTGAPQSFGTTVGGDSATSNFPTILQAASGFAAGSGSSYCPSLFTFGPCAGQVANGQGPFGSYLEHMGMDANARPGVHTLDAFGGQQGTYWKQLTLFNSDTAIIDACGDDNSCSNGLRMENIYGIRNNTASCPANTTAYTISGWTTGGSAYPNIAIVSGTVNSVTPYPGKSVVILGSTAGSSFDIDGTWKVVAVYDSAAANNADWDDLRAKYNGSSNLFSTAGQFAIAFPSGSTADSGATGGAASFYGVGESYINPAGAEEQSNVSMVANACSATEYPQTGFQLSGVGLNFTQFEAEGYKWGMILGADAPSKEITVNGYLSNTGTNGGIWLDNAWGTVANFRGININGNGNQAFGPLTLTAVDAKGNYTGTITGGAANGLVGNYVTVTGFTNSANDVTLAPVVASSSTILSIGQSTTTETHSGSASGNTITLYDPSPGNVLTGTNNKVVTDYSKDKVGGVLTTANPADPLTAIDIYNNVLAGYTSGTAKFSLNGSTGAGTFAQSVTSPEFCIESSCITTWPSGTVSSVFGRTGAVVGVSGDYLVAQVTGAAPLASPTFTGTVAAPTPSTSDNSTKIATTAYVQAQGYAPLASPTFTGAPTVPGYAKTGTLVSGNYTSATGAGTIGDSTVAAGPYAIGWITEPTGGNNGYLPSSAANKAMMWGVTLTYPLSTSQVTYDVGSNADNTGTYNYDLGLYNSSGTLVLNLNSGTLHGNSFAPATGAVALAWAQGNKTLQPGNYYLMYYSSNTTSTPPTLVSPSATAFTFYKGEAGGSGTCGTTQGSGGFAITPLGGGALPTSITPPANSYSWGACVPAIWIH